MALFFIIASRVLEYFYMYQMSMILIYYTEWFWKDWKSDFRQAKNWPIKVKNEVGVSDLQNKRGRLGDSQQVIATSEMNIITSENPPFISDHLWLVKSHKSWEIINKTLIKNV